MALAHSGFTVEAVCPSSHPIGKLAAAPRTYPYHGLRPLSSFLHAITAAKPDFIIPGDDLATLHLHQLHSQAGRAICSLIERSLGASDSFPVVLARVAFMELARELGISCPKTQVIAAPDDLRSFAATTGFPIVLKADGTSGGEGIRIVHTMDRAEQAFRKLVTPPMPVRAVKRVLFNRDKTLFLPSLLRRRFAISAQAFIPGQDATSAVACWHGAVLAALHFEVMSKAQPTGHATVVRSVENGDMSHAVEKIVRRLGLSGLHAFDFILESTTGKAHLIEINPRATQTGHLALGPRRDLPAALYAAVSGAPVKETKIIGHDTIALFPQEWIRDAASPFLRTSFHDVPWHEPDLVRACVLSRLRNQPQ
jgi:hypothetical protein